MKTRIFIVAACVFAFVAVSSSTAYCGPYYYRYGGCRGGCGYYDGWGWAAAIAGGVIAAGLIGNIIAYQYAQPPGKAQDSLVYVEPGTAYAYPDSAFIAKYGTKPAPDGSLGEWVLVPGQWVNGVWVDEHEVRIEAEQK
jgi:hypothetical protein